MSERDGAGLEQHSHAAGGALIGAHFPAEFGAGTPQQEHVGNAGALQKYRPGEAQHFHDM